MGAVITITDHRTFWQGLFHCPIFWRLKPAFKCPECGKTYRCYWDGNDCAGGIDLCDECAAKYEEVK